MLRGTLLGIHLLGVVIWLGAGVYDSFLAREIRRRRGTPAEVTLARLYVKYGPVIVGAMLTVALTGALQTSLLGWGWFSHFWLGAKQALMGIALVALAAVFPTFLAMNRTVGTISDAATELTPEALALFERTKPYIWVMRLAGFTALLLAVFRP